MKRLYDRGDRTKINPDHINRVEDILFRLDASEVISNMNWPGWNLHPLKGRKKGFWSVHVSGNFRVCFRFDNGDVFDVDYGDYH